MRISDWSSDVCSSDLVRSQAMQLTIGKLAQAGDVGVETIRYYQRRGLLDTPARSGGDGWGGGIRRYGEDDLRRLRFIRAAQGAGFPLDEIGELLALEARDARPRVRSLARQRHGVPAAPSAPMTHPRARPTPPPPP